MKKYKIMACAVCIMAILLVISVAFSSASRRKVSYKSVAQQQATPAPQIYSVKDKIVHVARQPQLPIAILNARNLENNWMQDWEFDIKNTSDKRIYYVGVDVNLPNIPKDEQGRGYGFYLTFGTPGLLTVDSRATANDPFLEPGATYTLKVPDAYWKGLESYVTRKGFASKSANRVNLRVSLISFGDGTGYIGGEPFPVKQTSMSETSLKNRNELLGLLTSLDVNVKKTF